MSGSSGASGRSSASVAPAASFFSAVASSGSRITQSGGAAEGALGLLRRTTSSLLMVSGGLAPARTFLCPICCENAREEERVVLQDCGKVDHGCCGECMGHYIRGLVLDGRVKAILCPHGRECGAVASPQEVQQLADEDTVEKFQRFQRMQQDRTLRQCPSCSALCKPEEANGDVVAEMQCSSCSAEFCYYHSNAHVGRPCEEYRREMAKEERLAMEGVIKGTRPCPSCGITTEKASGCNHMTCGSCQTNWCWTCGQALENIAWHYNPANPSGCQQFQDSDLALNSQLMRALRGLMGPVVVMSIILFGLCGLTFIIWFPITLTLMGPCLFRGVQMSHICFCASALTFLPFILVQIAWLPVALLLNLLFLPCGSNGRTLYFLLQVPFASVMAVLEGAH